MTQEEKDAKLVELKTEEDAALDHLAKATAEYNEVALTPVDGIPEGEEPVPEDSVPVSNE